MKKNFLKPIAIMGIAAMTMFSCTSATENTAVEAEPLDNTAVVTTDVDRMANQEIDYDEMFENVENTEQYGVLDLARMNPNLSTFVQLVEMSGLEPSFMQAEGITVLVPTNEAFNNMSKERFAYLTDPQNRTELVEVINRHILPSEVGSMQFNSSQVIETNGENDIPVSTEMQGTQVYIGGARIVKSDVEASNGILHVVDGIVQTSEFAAPGVQE